MLINLDIRENAEVAGYKLQVAGCN